MQADIHPKRFPTVSHTKSPRYINSPPPLLYIDKYLLFLYIHKILLSHLP